MSAQQVTPSGQECCGSVQSAGRRIGCARVIWLSEVRGSLLEECGRVLDRFTRP
jgi:hypothetical protein